MSYYDGDEKLLSSAAAGLTGGGAGGGEDALVARMALAMAGRRNGTISVGVTGSSVTAGHGNFGGAAWPLVLERRMAPVWKQLFGVRFVVHDQAVGGRDPWPASFCLEPMMGEDVDVVMREWEYWGAADGLVDDEVNTKKRGLKSDRSCTHRSNWSVASTRSIALCRVVHPRTHDSSQERFRVSVT